MSGKVGLEDLDLMSRRQGLTWQRETESSEGEDDVGGSGAHGVDVGSNTQRLARKTSL